MPWAKLTDTFDDDPDIDTMCDSAICLHVCGIAWCSRNLTNGRIPKARAQRLKGASNRSAIADLLRAGWWTEDGDDYLIRSYLAYNPSKEDVLKARNESGQRVTKFRQNRRASNTQSNGVGNADCNGVTPNVTHTDCNANVAGAPVSRTRVAKATTPIVPKVSLQKECAERFEHFWANFPTARRSAKAKCRAWFEKHKPDEATFRCMMTQLSRQAAAYDWSRPQYFPLSQTWLNQERWEDGDAGEFKPEAERNGHSPPGWTADCGLTEDEYLFATDPDEYERRLALRETADA